MWLAITERYLSDPGRLMSARPDRRATCPATRKGWMIPENASPKVSVFTGRAMPLPDGVRDEREVGVGHDQVDHDQSDESQHDTAVHGHAHARGARLGVEPLPRRDGGSDDA